MVSGEEGDANVRNANQMMLHLWLWQTTDFFVRPWEIYGKEEMIEVSGELKTPQEIRQKLYENIVDEAMYISRGSEGAVSLEWIMNQPIFIRKKYMKEMEEEIKERRQALEKHQRASK